MNQYKYHQKQREESKRLSQIKKDILLEKVKKNKTNTKNKHKDDSSMVECLFFVKVEIARCVDKYMKDEIAVELYIDIKTIQLSCMNRYGIAFNTDFINKTFGDIINLKKAEWREQQINSILED